MSTFSTLGSLTLVKGGLVLTAFTSSTTEPRDLPVFLHLHVTSLPGPDSIIRSSQAQQRRMERAAEQYEPKRIRKQLAQQVTSNPLASETRVRLDLCFQCFHLSILWTCYLKSVCLCLCLSVCFCEFVSVSLSLSAWLCWCGSVCLSRLGCHCLCVCLSISLYLYVCVSLSVCVSLFNCVALSVCLCLCVSVCVPLSLCVSLSSHAQTCHRCTCAHLLPLFSDLSCAIDHTSNAFALAQVVPKNRVALDMVAERRLSDATVPIRATPRRSTTPAAAAAESAASAEH